MLRKAERRGLIAANPVRGLEPDERPTVENGEKRILNEAELGKLLKGKRAYRVLIALFAFSGLRLGEALGLIWDDLDFEGGFIRVRAQLSRKRVRVIEKTAGSRREVVLVPQLAKALREHRMASRYKAPTDFVFPAPDGRGLLHSVAARGVERAVAKAGLEDVTPHTFRHGFASMLIVGLKLDPVNVARQLGHSDPAITLSTYSDLFERARHADEMRQALGDGFGHLLSAESS
jgi:integrase